MKKLDTSKPVQTRDGRRAKIVYTFKNSTHFVVLSDTNTDTEYWIIVDDEGKSFRSEIDDEIINTPERAERWVNIYPCLLGHESKIEADIQADNDRIACVKISYKIGEGL